MITKLDNLINRADWALLARSTTFKARVFRGSGRYEERSAQTLAAARITARTMGEGKPVAIYGVTPAGRSVYVENVYNRATAITGEDPMTLFVLAYLVPAISDPKVWKLPTGSDKVRAAAYVETLPENLGVTIVDSADALSKMGGPLLVKLYNEFAKRCDPPKPAVTKFESLPVARNRLFREMLEVAVDLPEESLTAAEATVAAKPEDPLPIVVTETQTPENQQGDDPMAKAAKKTDAPKKPRSKIDPASKIAILAESNPKREGTAAHKRFALYRNGMLVSTFLEKGGTSADLNWDAKHKLIKIERP